MSGLKIPYLGAMLSEHPSIISERMITSGAAINVDKLNWKNFHHKPDLKVYTGYCDRSLWLHYCVENDFVRAVCRNDQEPVWQDSCVEFFIGHNDFYRNFEFNSLGVCLSAFGAVRNERKPLEKEDMSQILRFPSLNIENLPCDNVSSDWSLTVAIPLSLIGVKPGDQFVANFYKCGDYTKVPHYISWSAIDTPTPDFHQPAYFALAELAK